MPPRIDPRDWDRYFRPGAARRGGPLRALANLLLVGAAIGLLGGGGFFALRFGLDRAQAGAVATARAIETSNAAFVATSTARTLASAATSTAVDTTPTAPTVLGRGQVLSGGNLRSEPRVAAETVIGQICAGDQIEFLEQRTAADGSLWYRIRVIEVATNCSPQRVSLGSRGWASATLLSEPAP